MVGWGRNRARQRGGSAARLAARTSADFRSTCDASGLAFDRRQAAAIDALCAPTRRGFYLHGGVGRGKTQLAERYFASVPSNHKRRFHFHEFFREIQTTVGGGVPLTAAVTQLIADCHMILFDEFHVHDVADAIYLTEMLRALVDSDTLVVATSNYRPADLLPNPLFHDRFLPAIDLITEHWTVIDVGTEPDYRPLHPRSHATGFASGSWRVESPGTPSTTAKEDIGAPADRVGITFRELCERPRSAHSYLALTESRAPLLLREVPDLASVGPNALQRFAILIDVLHDRDIRLDVVAASAPDRWPLGTATSVDAERAVSRLRLLSTG